MDFTRELLRISGFGKITLYIQRYECRKCGHGFSAHIDGIVEKGHWHCHIFKEMVNAVAAVIKYSSRKIQQMFSSIWDFTFSPDHRELVTG